MTTDTQTDLQGFYEFIAGKLREGDKHLSPEKALALWRERRETVDSILRGLADANAGRTKPAQDVLNSLGDGTQTT